MADATTRSEKKKPITLQDIATRCGVTKTAVTLALRHDKQISKPVAERIRATAEEMGYDPLQQMLARRLAAMRHGVQLPNRVIFAAFPKLFQQARYFIEISCGIFDVLEATRYSLLMSYFAQLEGDTDETGMPLPVASGEVDGVIAVPVGPDIERMMELLTNTKSLRTRPVVSVMHQIPGYPSILTDDQQGAYDAASHLLDLGHRHLLQFVTRERNDNMQRRLSGIRNAYMDHGLSPETYLRTFIIDFSWLNPYTLLSDVAEGSSVWDHDETRERLTAYMAQHPEVTGIMASNDVSATRAWYALQQAGFRIPEDISLIGFDDTDPKVNELGQNQLTSVRLPLADAGRAAARYVLRRIQGEDVENEVIMLSTELMVRASTAVCAHPAG